MNRSTVVVHGAGAQGSAVVRGLVAAGHRVRVVVRRPDRAAGLHPDAEPVAADLLDSASLVAAYAGADAVVVQLPLVVTAGIAESQARTVLDALRTGAVPRAVFNTGGTLATAPIGVPFVDARVLLATGLADSVEHASVVSPARTYMENLSAPWSRPLVEDGVLAYPLPADLPVPWLAADDLGTAVVDLIAEPVPLRVVAGPRALRGEDAAAELGSALGRPVRWRTVEPAEYERMLRPHLGPEVAAGIAAAYAPPPPGSPQPQPPAEDVVVTGRTSLRDWAARQHWSWTSKSCRSGRRRSCSLAGDEVIISSSTAQSSGQR